MEIWKTIKDFPDYEISYIGEVRNVKTGQYLKPYINSAGYFLVTPSKKNKKYNKYIHRLVAEAFIGQCPIKKQVNHKDGNKLNNVFTNLEYVYQSDNIIHARKNGLLKSKQWKLTYEDVMRIKDYWATGTYSKAALGRLFNVSASTISRIIHEKIWKNKPPIKVIEIPSRILDLLKDLREEMRPVCKKEFFTGKRKRTWHNLSQIQVRQYYHRIDGALKEIIGPTSLQNFRSPHDGHAQEGDKN